MGTCADLIATRAPCQLQNDSRLALRICRASAQVLALTCSPKLHAPAFRLAPFTTCTRPRLAAVLPCSAHPIRKLTQPARAPWHEPAASPPAHRSPHADRRVRSHPICPTAKLTPVYAVRGCVVFVNVLRPAPLALYLERHRFTDRHVARPGSQRHTPMSCAAHITTVLIPSALSSAAVSRSIAALAATCSRHATLESRHAPIICCTRIVYIGA